MFSKVCSRPVFLFVCLFCQCLAAHKKRMNPLRRSSCQRESRRDFGVQHDGVASASSCHAKVTMGRESFEKKKTRGNLSKDFSAVYGSGRNLFLRASIECGAQHWYSGCQKVEWRDWTLVAEGVGAYLFTKTRGDPPKNGLIPKH